MRRRRGWRIYCFSRPLLTSLRLPQAWSSAKTAYLLLTVAFLVVLILSAVGVPRQWSSYKVRRTSTCHRPRPLLPTRGRLRASRLSQVSMSSGGVSAELGTLTVYVTPPGSAKMCASGGSCSTSQFDDSSLFGGQGIGDKDKIISGAKSAYAFGILLAIFGGFGLLSSAALLLREFGMVKLGGKLLLILSIVFGAVATLMGMSSLIGYGAGVNATFADNKEFPASCESASSNAHPLPPLPTLFCVRALPVGAGTTLTATLSWLDGFALILTSFLVAVCTTIGAIVFMFMGGGGEPKGSESALPPPLPVAA